MGAVVTYQTNTPTPRQPAIQVSTLPPKMTTGQDLLKKASSRMARLYWPSPALEPIASEAPAP